MYRRTIAALLTAGCALALAMDAAGGTTPLGQVFTYQGQLKSGGALFSGNADLRFTLFETAAGATQVVGTPILTVTPVTVDEGVFTVTLNFGPGAFNGFERYLGIEVTAPSTAGAGPWTLLTPRQRVDAAPYALHALSATIAGLQPNAVNFTNAGNIFNGTHTGSGAGLTALNATNLTSGTLASARLSGAYANALNFTNVANTYAGVFTGDGSGLTNIDAADITTGNLNIARMPLGGAWGLTSDLSIDAASVFVDISLNRVGLGITTPDARLHVHAGTAGAVTANANANLVVEDSGNNYINLLTPDASENGVLFGTTSNAANGAIIFNSASLPNGLQFRTGGNVTHMSINSAGDVSLSSSINMTVGESIDTNGQLTMGGANLRLRLGDSTADQVSVPAREFFMSDTVSVADGDQNLYFTDAASSTANFIRWDDVSAFACAGTVGNLNSVFDFHIGDDIDAGWVFTTGATSTDAEIRWDDDGNVQADGGFSALNACDLAEGFFGPDLPPGTLVVLDPNNPETVIASTRSYESGIVGAVSTQPAFLMNGPAASAYPLLREWKAFEEAASMSASERALSEELNALNSAPETDASADSRRGEIMASLQSAFTARANANVIAAEYERQFDALPRGNVPVALVGRVPVRVIGPVRAGDHLTTSEVPGVAMAMTQAGPTVGIALEDFLGAGEGLVVTLIQPGWHGSTNAAEVEALRNEVAELRSMVLQLTGLQQRP